jgi:hypothetical protein
MAGTVKLCVPELVLEEELVACAEDVARVEVADFAEAVAVLDDLAAVECTLVGDAAGDDEGGSVSVGDAAGGSDEAGADTAAEELDPLAPHAVRPAPPMMTAIIAAAIRHFPMPQSSIE